MTDWIITVPKTISWEDYEKELENAKNGSILLYRVPSIPKKLTSGDRCFVTWNLFVRGWMRVHCGTHMPHGFTCSTTGKHWEPGFYISRVGEFYEPKKKHVYPGFRGIREFPEGADL